MNSAGGDEHSPVARRDSDDLRFTIVDGDEAREGRASRRSGRMEASSMTSEVEVGRSREVKGGGRRRVRASKGTTEQGGHRRADE